MILGQDPETGYWNRTEDGRTLRTHAPDKCEGRLCDVHNRRGDDESATWPLNWRTDRGIMEVICEHEVGHPSAAQVQFWLATKGLAEAQGESIHGCCGCCGVYWKYVKPVA